MVTEDSKAVDVIKGYASAPWETNLLHEPGISPLEADLSVWSQKALTLFCPMSMSPALLSVKEVAGDFMHVKAGG